MNGRGRDALLIGLFLALAGVYVAWFWQDKHWLATQLVFTAPPLLLALGTWCRRGNAPFWSGVLALFWFSHGVMSAWSHPDTAGWAWAELLLALAIIGVANAPGLQKRFKRR